MHTENTNPHHNEKRLYYTIFIHNTIQAYYVTLNCVNKIVKQKCDYFYL